MSAETFTATVDVTTLQVFPAHDPEWLADILWQATTLVGEAHDFDALSNDQVDVYVAAERVARDVDGMAPLLTAVMGEMLSYLVSIGAVHLTVQHDGDEAEKYARLTAEGVVTAFSSAACLAALMLGTALLTERQMFLDDNEAAITVPVTVTTGGAA